MGKEIKDAEGKKKRSGSPIFGENKKEQKNLPLEKGKEAERLSAKAASPRGKTSR